LALRVIGDADRRHIALEADIFVVFGVFRLAHLGESSLGLTFFPISTDAAVLQPAAGR
jgi:hypothetical protein